MEHGSKSQRELRFPDFRALFDAVPGLYLVVFPDDPTFTIVLANKAYLQATITSLDEIAGHGLFEVFPDDPTDPNATGSKNLLSSLRTVLATKAAHTMPAQKYPIRLPDELGGGFEDRYWSPVNTPLLDDSGEVEFIIHRVEDVTELIRIRRMEAQRGELTRELSQRADEIDAELFFRTRELVEFKRLQQERQEMEEKLLARFRLAFAEAPIGMVLLTPDGKVVEVNTAFLGMLGFTREQLELRSSTEYTHPEDVGLSQAFFASLTASSSDTGSIEKRYVRRDGEVFWGRATAIVRRDESGKPLEIIAIVEDITERKRTEQRYRFLAESIPQMVWTASADGQLDYVNGRGCAYLGAPQEALLGVAWLNHVHPEDQAQTLKHWKTSLVTGLPYETEFRLKRGADHSWHWHLARALPLRSDSGNITQWFGTFTDIHSQRQSDAELRRQWRIFDTALSNTPDYTFTLDLSGRFTYANRRLLELWQKPLEELVGKKPNEITGNQGVGERLERQIASVIQTRETVRDSASFTAPNGRTGIYEYILVPVIDANGRIEGVAGSSRDVTEQDQFAKQIEEDRRRWRDLLAQTPAAIAVFRGPDHRYDWVNSEYARVVQRPPEALLGKRLSEVFPELKGQIYVDLLERVYRTGEPYSGHESFVRLNQGDGSFKERYINFIYVPTRDAVGTIDGIFAHIVDVTDAVLARQKIEESEQQFRTLAESMPNLAWMADGSGSIFWYNRRWYEYTGTTLEDVYGWGWEKVHDPKVLPEVLEAWRRAIATGDRFEMVYPLRGFNGEFRTFLTRIEPVKDSHERVVRWFGTNTDITEQQETEEELRRMNRELEEFAYVASHDLQEPLRMVNIYTQLILAQVKDASEDLTLYSGFVSEGVTRMEALIRDLLTFSRSIHSEHLPAGIADLTASLTEASSVLKARIEESGALIRASTLPLTQGDTAQVAHVFQNLLSNALKYRKPGVVPEIEISAEANGTHWIVSVRDNGIGFEPRYSERIFGLFKRLHKDEYPGTGLGLAICRRIVERYGGRMWAESALGKGSTFYFSLPIATEQ